ncbi:MAG TPA: sigma-70 family RNA polymerase sigma factor, partial [Isosphaeraceae bacterium]|nr:sigma-70 family RNA polymerase sigma factor [Isosphaeraceae bacterium]
MAVGTSSAVLENLNLLFQVGVVGSLTDAELLERFAAGGRGAEAAFEALLARHGPMVYGVCRRVLRDPHDVQDAFQATFLVLVRKADSLRDPGFLGNWLYGVACRVSAKARAAELRRRACEERAGKSAAHMSQERDGHELRSVLDEEIRRLPSKFREPIILCYLHGMRHEEVAQRIGCPVGTVESRLSRARERLRVRLAHRGVAPAVGLMFSALAPEASADTALTRSALRIAMQAKAGASAGVGSAIPAGVAALANGVVASMAVTKLVLVAATILTVSVATAGLGMRLARAPEALQPNQKAVLEQIEKDPPRLDLSGSKSQGIPKAPESSALASPSEAPPAEPASVSVRAPSTSALSEQNPGPIPVAGPILEAPLAATSPVADGVISKGEYGPPWEIDCSDDKNPGREFANLNASGIKPAVLRRAKSGDDLSYRVYAAHTAKSLFLAFAVRDQVIDAQKSGEGRPFTNDCVEIFLDGDRVPNDFRGGVDVGNGGREGFQLLADTADHKLTVGSGLKNSDWTVGSSRTPDGYVIEFEIPLELIDTVDGPGFAAAKSGSVLRFNAAVTDNDQAINLQTYYSVLWSEQTPVL